MYLVQAGTLCEEEYRTQTNASECTKNAVQCLTAYALAHSRLKCIDTDVIIAFSRLWIKRLEAKADL